MVSSQSSSGPRYSDGLCQSPCSRQTTLKPASARRRATTPPDAPAPMMRTSAGSAVGTTELHDAHRHGSQLLFGRQLLADLLDAPLIGGLQRIRPQRIRDAELRIQGCHLIGQPLEIGVGELPVIDANGNDRWTQPRPGALDLQTEIPVHQLSVEVIHLREVADLFPEVADGHDS